MTTQDQAALNEDAVKEAETEQHARGEAEPTQHIDETAAPDESFALPGDEPVADKNAEYLKGDPDLIVALKQLNDHKVDPKNKDHLPAIEQQIGIVTSLLDADKNLRLRVVSAVGVAEDNMDVVLQTGAVVENLKQTQVSLPYGMHKSVCDVAGMINDGLTKYAEEVAPGTDMAEVLNAIVAPLIHRAALAEIALLKLRMFYAPNVHTFEPRQAAVLSDIVADAETVVNGTYPAYLARLQGYAEPEWNFTLLENNKDGDLSTRKLFVYADGIEVPVVVFPYIGIMQTPQGTASLVDYSLLQIVTQERRLVPVRSIGCWRTATEEEAASDVFKSAMEIYEQQRSAHESIQIGLAAQEKAQEQADNAAAAGLILPEGVKKGEEPKLILPN